MMRLVFFRCGVIELTNKKERDLTTIYESELSWKLNLRANFLRKLLYIRKNAMSWAYQTKYLHYNGCTLAVYCKYESTK